MNITVRAVDADGLRDRDHTNVSGWDVTNGTLWIMADSGNVAVYAPGQWQWVERFPEVPADHPAHPDATH